MKTIFAIGLMCFVLQSNGCGDAEAAKPAPVPPVTGQRAIAVDGKESGKIEKQADGTYLLRYANGNTDRVSANEIILIPESK